MGITVQAYRVAIGTYIHKDAVLQHDCSCHSAHRCDENNKCGCHASRHTCDVNNSSDVIPEGPEKTTDVDTWFKKCTCASHVTYVVVYCALYVVHWMLLIFFNCLLQCGDVEENPGPHSIQNASSGIIHVKPDDAKCGPIENIYLIQQAYDKLQSRLYGFCSLKSKQEYIYLEEMLTRLLIQLDGIESDGKEDICQLRKQTVHSVQAGLDYIERTAKKSIDEPTTEHQQGVEKTSYKHTNVASQMDNTGMMYVPSCP